jgi:hypothetical protein
MLPDIPVTLVRPGGLETSASLRLWAVLHLLHCCVVLIATQTVLIHFLKRPVGFHSMYFTVRDGASTRKRLSDFRDGKCFFIVFWFIFSFMFGGNQFLLIFFSCWNHNWQ